MLTKITRSSVRTFVPLFCQHIEEYLRMLLAEKIIHIGVNHLQLIYQSLLGGTKSSGHLSTNMGTKQEPPRKTSISAKDLGNFNFGLSSFIRFPTKNTALRCGRHFVQSYPYSNQFHQFLILLLKLVLLPFLLC